MKRISASLLSLCSVTAFVGTAPRVAAAPITPGNLVVLRVGDGAAALTAVATAISLDEFTPAGVLVQSIPVPSSGATTALTIGGSATAEGQMGRSQDGNMLLISGYRKDAGGTAPSTDLPAVTPRVIGTLFADGTLSTGIALTDTTNTIRGATTVSGSSYYFATSTSVRYMADPAQTTSVSIDNRNSRAVVLSGNTLFACNGSTAAGFTAKVQSYGTLPTGTTTPTPIVNLAVNDAVNCFLLSDVDPAVPGDDTLYLGSQVENQLRKYTFDGSAWTDRSSMPAAGINNLTGQVTGTTVTLFGTSAGTLYSLTDTSGPGGTLSGTLTTLTTAGTNRAFRGISMFPSFAAANLTLLSWSVTPLAGGGQHVAVSVSGTPGINARLECSDDLIEWITLQTMTLDDSGLASFDIDDATAGDRRFYRVAAP